MSRFVLDLGGRRVRLTDGLWRIGRDPTSEIHLDDASVSRRHASLRVGPNRLEILDSGSRNGVRVNGDRIHGVVALSEGDEIRIGSETLRLLERDPSDVDPMAPATAPLPRLTESDEPVTATDLQTLSPREREVLGRLARGETQKVIAEALGVSVKTVETYRARIGRKLDLRTRSELVRFALDAGLLRPE